MFPLKLYSLYDKLAKGFHAPFPAENDDVAIRNFSEILQDSRGSYSKHPGDYWLYRMGEFHQDSGAIVAEGEVVRIHEGVGGPGVPSDVDYAERAGLEKFGAWLQKQAKDGVDVKKLLDRGGVQ